MQRGKVPGIGRILVEISHCMHKDSGAAVMVSAPHHRSHPERRCGIAGISRPDHILPGYNTFSPVVQPHQ